MSDESQSTEAGQPAGGVVQELARDDVERKKFLKMAGKTIGAGAAATGLGRVHRGLRRQFEQLAAASSCRRHRLPPRRRRARPPAVPAIWRSSTTR